MNVSEAIRATSRPRWGDKWGLRLNTPPTANQDVWVRNPTFVNASTGAFALWVRFPVVLATNGTIAIKTLGRADNGDYMWFCLRRNSNYDAPTNVVDIAKVVGGSISTKSGSTTIAADTWYLVGLDSAGDLWVNGTKETPSYWHINHYTSGYYNDIGGSIKDYSIGTTRFNGIVGSYHRVDVNDSYEFNAVLTAPEWAELFAAGMGTDPRLLSPGLVAKIINVWDFEKRLVPAIGTSANTLTGANISSGDYIAI